MRKKHLKLKIQLEAAKSREFSGEKFALGIQPSEKLNFSNQAFFHGKWDDKVYSTYRSYQRAAGRGLAFAPYFTQSKMGINKFSSL